MTAVKKILDEAKKLNQEYHYLNTVSESLALAEHPAGKLSGIAFSVKDCICVKGIESASGSKILSGYKPPFDATVIARIKAEGGIIIGKTAQDEFGFGSFSTNVGQGLQVPLNPFDKERCCGGSSGGSAGLTQQASFRHISISESTGGSIVCPASFCGVLGLCPTYGLISRYGLIDYANSMDKIGVMAKTAEDIALALTVMAGYDEADSTSANHPKEDYVAGLGRKKGKLKIGVIKEGFGQGVDQHVAELVKRKIAQLKEEGHTVEEVSLPLNSSYALETYYLIAMCESSTNLAKYCGMRYGFTLPMSGSFNEYFSKVRTEAFGDEAKRRIILGTFARMAGYRDAYYIKALKVRAKLVEEYNAAFTKYDLLISPTMPIIAPRFDELKKLTPLQNYMIDILTVGPNLAGLPHISIPAGTHDGMPVGLMAIGPHFGEQKLLALAKLLEAA